jgi:DNA-binding NtrC family response regulator
MNIIDSKPLAGKRILLVEDEFFIAMALEEYLADSGSQHVESVGTLADAEALARRDSFDAAILDIRLPDGETYGLASELIPEGCAVVFHSGHAEEKQINAIPSSYFCSKPCAADHLIEVVSKAIERMSGRA